MEVSSTISIENQDLIPDRLISPDSTFIPSSYTEFKSLADALCAVAHAQSVQKMKSICWDYYKNNKNGPSKYSKTNILNKTNSFKQKHKASSLKGGLRTFRDVRTIFSANDDQDDNISFSTVEDISGGVIPVRSITTQTSDPADSDKTSVPSKSKKTFDIYDSKTPAESKSKKILEDSDNEEVEVEANRKSKVSVISEMAAYVNKVFASQASSSKVFIPAVQSVIVQNVPYNNDGEHPYADNSVQLLQEKIVLATSRALTLQTTLNTKVNSGKHKTASASKITTANGNVSSPIKKPTLTGMLQLLEELNEPFIPEGYELKGKNLELASLAVKSLQELLNTDLFKSIEKDLPSANKTSKNQKRPITWSSNLRNRHLKAMSPVSSASTSYTRLIQPSAPKPMGNTKVQKSNNDNFAPTKQMLQNLEKYGSSMIKPPLKIKTIPKSRYDFELRKKRTPVVEKDQAERYAEKGLVGFEIDEYYPSSTVFYQDVRGNYKSR